MQQSDKLLNKNTIPKTKLRNIMVTISYDGSAYHGWQIQKNALSVQEVFQNALFKIIKHLSSNFKIVFLNIGQNIQIITL